MIARKKNYNSIDHLARSKPLVFLINLFFLRMGDKITETWRETFQQNIFTITKASLKYGCFEPEPSNL